MADVEMSRGMQYNKFTGTAVGSGQPYALVMKLKGDGRTQIDSLTAHYNHPDPQKHGPSNEDGRRENEVLYPVASP